ncbi:MAG: energy transducer TonB [Taibaiella sp.]|jgi:protein TonB
MKYFIPVLFITSLSLCAQSKAQDTSTKGLAVHYTLEKPQFPGGDQELEKYLSLNLRYPNEALKLKIEGEVMIAFTIDEEGLVQDIRTVKDIGYGCGPEAERVVSSMPRWNPARKGGKAIKINYRLPVVFELPEGTLK